MSCGARRSRGIPLALPLKSLPSEQEVVGEVSVRWPWGILRKLLKIIAGSQETEIEDHLSLYRASCFLTSLESRAMHNEVNYLEQSKMGNPEEKEEEEKCLSCCSCSFSCLCPYLGWSLAGHWRSLGATGTEG